MISSNVIYWEFGEEIPSEDLMRVNFAGFVVAIAVGEGLLANRLFEVFEGKVRFNWIGRGILLAALIVMEAETRVRLPRKVASLKKVSDAEISSDEAAENEEGSDEDPDAGAEGADYGNDSDSYNATEGAKSAKTGADEPDLADDLGEDAEGDASDFNDEVSFGPSIANDSAETDEEKERSWPAIA